MITINILQTYEHSSLLSESEPSQQLDISPQLSDMTVILTIMTFVTSVVLIVLCCGPTATIKAESNKEEEYEYEYEGEEQPMEEAEK